MMAMGRAGQPMGNLDVRFFYCFGAPAHLDLRFPILLGIGRSGMCICNAKLPRPNLELPQGGGK